MIPEILSSVSCTGQAVRVLLIDDEEMSWRGLSAALEEEAPGITVVGHVRVSAEVLKAVNVCRPHVILMNAVTDGDWVGIIQSILDGIPGPQHPRAIVVVDGGNEGQVFQAVYSGASGVLQRSMSSAELNYAVRQVAMGHSVVSPAATSLMLMRLRALVAGGSHSPAGNDAIGALSGREREVLVALAAGKSNQEIATETHLSLATVKSHVSSILAKLDVRDRVQAALIGQSSGISGKLIPAVAPASVRRLALAQPPASVPRPAPIRPPAPGRPLRPGTRLLTRAPDSSRPPAGTR